jgi:phosphoribosylaminoimidazole-succinocarboxamide synthase
MARDTQPTKVKPVHPDWVLELDGADILSGQAALPEFKSTPWTIHFSLPSDLSELEGVADPLLFIYAGSGFVRDIESKMDLLVAMAREQGRSWTEIGRALGVTKQTAWARLARVVSEGKTKIVEDAGNGEVFVRSKDDITAGDGAKHDVLDGKAAASTRTTRNVFRLLERNGIPTHFVNGVDDVTFRARDVEMIPLELVARRYATGSFRDRFPDLADGAVLEELVFEIFEKDDVNHDPLLEFDFGAGVLRRYVANNKAAEAIGTDLKAGDLISEEPVGESRYADVSPELIASLRSRTASAFEVIEDAWKQQGGVYIDFKIECGFDRETGKLLVADVIDSDSGRLRFDEVDMSKQSYRDGTATLPEIKKKYEEVAALTDRFV